MIRLGFVLGVFAIGCVCLIAIQSIARLLGFGTQPRVSMFFYRILRWLLRLRVRVVGIPVKNQPVLIVSNHMSWIDIAAIGAVMPLHFVAKREVRDWPLVGLVAELTGTVFVDRTRRQQTADVNNEIAKRLADGNAVVLFAEGTSSDGNRILPFRSALIGAAGDLLAEGTHRHIALQPLSIAYTHLNGLPMGRQHRPFLAWYGDTDFLPHLRRYLRNDTADAVVTFGQPVPFEGQDRKAATRYLEATVRGLTSGALRGRTTPETG